MPTWTWVILGIAYIATTIGAVMLFFQNVDTTKDYLIRNRGKSVTRGKNGKKDEMSPR